jgi:hypothetical protein
MYEGRLKSSWTHFITPSRNLVEVWWRSLFSKYLPWQAVHFLQRSTHFSKTCCRLLITSKFLASELPFHGWKSPGRVLDCMADILMGFHRSTFSKPNREFNSDLAPCKKFRSYQRFAAHIREVGGALWEVHRLPREVLRERSRHSISTKFRLGVTRWVHEVCNGPRIIVKSTVQQLLSLECLKSQHFLRAQM